MNTGDLSTFAIGRKTPQTKDLTGFKSCGFFVRDLLTCVDNSPILALNAKASTNGPQVFAQARNTMPLKVKDISKSATKFVSRAQVAGPDYTAGVQAAGTSQYDNALAAAPNWAAGVQTAAANGSFAKGLQKVGPSKWSTNAANKGAKNYPSGVASAQAAYTTGVTPYFTVLQNLNLTQRYPRGDPRNQQRSVDVQTALHKAKVGS